MDEPTPETLAIRLEAIGAYISDQAQNNTTTSSTMLAAAQWLRKLDRSMCAQGYIGCRGGKTCQSDHK